MASISASASVIARLSRNALPGGIARSRRTRGSTNLVRNTRPMWGLVRCRMWPTSRPDGPPPRLMSSSATSGSNSSTSALTSLALAQVRASKPARVSRSVRSSETRASSSTTRTLRVHESTYLRLGARGAPAQGVRTDIRPRGWWVPAFRQHVRVWRVVGGRAYRFVRVAHDRRVAAQQPPIRGERRAFLYTPFSALAPPQRNSRHFVHPSHPCETPKGCTLCRTLDVPKLPPAKGVHKSPRPKSLGAVTIALMGPPGLIPLPAPASAGVNLADSRCSRGTQAPPVVSHVTRRPSHPQPSSRAATRSTTRLGK